MSRSCIQNHVVSVRNMWSDSSFTLVDVVSLSSASRNQWFTLSGCDLSDPTWISYRSDKLSSFGPKLRDYDTDLDFFFFCPPDSVLRKYEIRSFVLTLLRKSSAETHLSVAETFAFWLRFQRSTPKCHKSCGKLTFPYQKDKTRSTRVLLYLLQLAVVESRSFFSFQIKTQMSLF